jgi:hypothetical protein
MTQHIRGNLLPTEVNLKPRGLIDIPKEVLVHHIIPFLGNVEIKFQEAKLRSFCEQLTHKVPNWISSGIGPQCETDVRWINLRNRLNVEMSNRGLLDSSEIHYLHGAFDYITARDWLEYWIVFDKIPLHILAGIDRETLIIYIQAYLPKIHHRIY